MTESGMDMYEYGEHRTTSAAFADPGQDEHEWAGPATWAQQAFWDGLRRYDCTSWHGSIAAVWAVPDGWTLEGVLDLAGRTVSRYEGLRTDVHEGADGGLLRHVRGRGEFPVEIVEAGPAAGPAAHAARLRARQLTDTGDLPFAAAVVTADGRPRHLVWAVSHLAADASSGRILLRYLGAPRDTPVLQPGELAAQEAGERLALAGRRSVTAWARIMGGAALPFTDRRTAPDAGGILQQTLTSRPAGARLEALTAALATDSSAVLLAAVSVALGAVSGARTLPLQVVTSNRHRPGAEDYLGVLAQFGPMALDLDPDRTFADAVCRASRGSMRAYTSAMWSPAALDAALRVAGRSVDEVLGATYTFNDVRGGFPPVLEHPAQPDPGRDHAVLPLPWWPYQGGRCAIAVTGGSGLLQFALRADTAYVDPARAGMLLPAVDAVLRRAHEDGVATRVGDLADAAAALRPTAGS